MLSVIIPVYNEEKYLEECLKSILFQKNIDFEIIIIDDCSTDSTPEICDKYKNENSIIRVIHSDRNEGISRSRLKGVEVAQGEFVTFVDGDDWISDGYYENAFKNYSDEDIIITGENKGNEKSGWLKRSFYFESRSYNRDDMNSIIIPKMMWDVTVNEWMIEPSLCTKIFKKQLLYQELKNAEHLGATYGEDTVVFYPMMLRANKVRLISSAYYNYRQRDPTVIPDYIKNNNYLNKVCDIYNYLQNRFKDLQAESVMREQLDLFFINSVCNKKKQYDLLKLKCHHFDAVFPFKDITPGSNVVLYGAGLVGNEYYRQNLKYRFCNIILWCDASFSNINNILFKISNPEDIMSMDYDYVIVAIDQEIRAMSAITWLKNYGVDDDKIVWSSTRRKVFEDLI